MPERHQWYRSSVTFLALLAAMTGVPALGAAPEAPRADALSNAERRIVAEVDRRQPQALVLLKKAVEINSGTMNLAGVKKVGNLFAAALADLGFEIRWVDGADFDRAGHLVAHRGGSNAPGSSGPHLLLIGHLDTVFGPDDPFQHFDRLDARHARGPGVIDMKGGDVVIVEALAALKTAGALDDLQITVVMTGDEERAGRPLSLARQALVQAADMADVALGFESSDGDPATAVIARRGYTGWDLRVSAMSSHSSRIFHDDVGDGAVFEAARILNGFRTELAGERYLTFNPALVVAGTRVDYDAADSAGNAFGKANVIAGNAMVSGDLRTLSADQLASVKERMTKIISRHLPGASADIEFTEGYPPLAPTNGNRRLLSMYDQVSRDLGLGSVGAVDPSRAGAADISFTAGRVSMALDGLGLMGRGDHTAGETADLTTLPGQTKRAALLMYRLRQWQADPANTPDP